MGGDELQSDGGDAPGHEDAGLGGHWLGPGNVSRRSIRRFYFDPSDPASWRRQGTREVLFLPSAWGYPPRDGTRSREAMTLNRWKVLACTLTIGVGGLAVFATPPRGDKTEPTKEPAPLPNLTVKPTSP